MPDLRARFSRPAWLRPGESGFVPLQDVRGELPLGSALVFAEGGDRMADYLVAVDQMHLHPGCCVALIRAAPLEPRERLIWARVGIDPATFPLPQHFDHLPVAVRGAVAVRDRPRADAIAAYLIRRHAGLGSLFSELLARGGASEGSLRRRFRRIGQFGPKHWREAVGLLEALHISSTSSSGLLSAAVLVDHDPRTLRRWSQSLAGMDWSPLAAMGCWEAALEVMLRYGRYVAGPALPGPGELEPATRAG